MADEVNDIKRFGGIIKEYTDVNLILEIARNAAQMQDSISSEQISEKKEVTIGIARDPAFCFYYQDNLDKLSTRAELVLFSPMNDDLPQVDGLLFWRRISGAICTGTREIDVQRQD